MCQFPVLLLLPNPTFCLLDLFLFTSCLLLFLTWVWTSRIKRSCTLISVPNTKRLWSNSPTRSFFTFVVRLFLFPGKESRRERQLRRTRESRSLLKSTHFEGAESISSNTSVGRSFLFWWEITSTLKNKTLNRGDSNKVDFITSRLLS